MFFVFFWFLQTRLTYRARPRRLSSGVPAIVFGYPRHSGATDEGMTSEHPIFAYLGFGSGKVSLRKPLRPIKAAV
jgi:hypothetical protein